MPSTMHCAFTNQLSNPLIEDLLMNEMRRNDDQSMNQMHVPKKR
jgi:hypothetical protein